MKEKTAKSRGKRIAVVIALVVLAVAGTVVAKNYDNIIALYKGFTTSTDDLDVDIEKNKQDTADALSNAGINISQEDFDKLNNGNLSAEEIAELIQNGLSSDENTENKADDAQTGNVLPESETENNVPETDIGDEPETVPEQTPTGHTPTEQTPVEQAPVEQTPQETKPEVQTPTVPTQTTEPEQKPEPKPEQKPVETPSQSNAVLTEAEYNKRVADLVAKMYVIKSDFLSTLSDFENRIISEYKALPAEKRTTATKAKIVADNMSYVLSLEAQCDAQVEAVTNELYELIKANGKDTAFVDAIKAAYQNEKELKKAYYVSLYK